MTVSFLKDLAILMVCIAAMTPTVVGRLGRDAPSQGAKSLVSLRHLTSDCVGRVIEGTAEDDQLTGTDCDDTIIGNGGNDIISGGGGHDLIIGGDGHDDIVGGDGDDTIQAGRGFDTVQGNSGNDIIEGSEGDDELFGGGGADKILGGDGSDVIVGGDGSDDLVGGRGMDTVQGNSGDDKVQGNDGDDDLTGGAGSDTITGGDGSDKIDGGDGSDSISGGMGEDFIRAGSGLDTVVGSDGSDTINGGSGDDWIQGENGSDLINGGTGSMDTLIGGRGSDTLNSGIKASSGSDTDNDDSDLDTFEWVQFGGDVNGFQPYGYFGGDVALSDNGLVMAVGALRVDDKGMVQVFYFSEDRWVQMGQNITGRREENWFADAIALSGDGEILAIGAWVRGNNHGGPWARDGRYAEVYWYNYDEDEWQEVGYAKYSDGDRLGYSIALSQDGGILAVGDADLSGKSRVEIFEYAGTRGDWTPLGKDIVGASGPDSGVSLSISADGHTVAIGYRDYPSTGHVRIYRFDPSIYDWKQKGSNISGTSPYQEAHRVQISGDGSRIVIGSEWTPFPRGTPEGRVCVFDYDGLDWVKKGENIDVEGISYGSHVAISRDGQIVASGGFGYARVYEFSEALNRWLQLGLDIQSDTFLSIALSQDGSIVAVGANQTTVAGNYQLKGQVKSYRYENET